MLSIGVDVGATKIASALVAEDGQVLASRKAFTRPEQGCKAVLDSIADEVRALIGEAGRAGQDHQLLGVGIGVPGRVDSRQGRVYNAVNLGWVDVNLVDEIQDRLGGALPVWIQKDANASALGEHYFGAAKDCKDFIYLGVGSGLGGGLMVQGELVTGANWNAVEVGHISLDPAGGRLCSCGLRGCAETIVSGPGLVRTAQDLLNRNVTGTELKQGEALTPDAIIKAAERKDALALAALEIVGQNLGIVMAAGVAYLNPERIVVGGGLGQAAYRWLAPASRASLEQRVLPGSHSNLQILPSAQASSAVGAACLAWYFHKLEQKN